MIDETAAERFHRPDGIYLSSHSVGLLPVDAASRVDGDHLEVWRRRPQEAWDHWLAEIDAFRMALAVLFDHDQSCFCPQPNVSGALTKILWSLPRDSGRTQIVLSEEAFPSVGFVCAAAGERGYEVDFVPSTVDARDPDVWAARLDARTAAVVVTHVHSNTGELLPVDRITAVAKEREVVSVVDVAQSAGVVPVDLRRWDADFVVGSCVKWLCGGPGAGYLWVRPEMIERCRPIDVGWFSHGEPFEFDIHHFRFADDARRFWGGTPSVLPATLARHSIELLTELGIEAVREHNTALTARLIAGLPDTAIVGPRDAAARGGTVVVDGGRAEELERRLVDASIHVDRRATGVRISPHVYNTAADIDAVLARW